MHGYNLRYYGDTMVTYFSLFDTDCYGERFVAATWFQYYDAATTPTKIQYIAHHSQFEI